MLSAGLRLVLAVVAPLVGAALVHELRRHRRAGVWVGAAAVVACAVLTASVVPAVAAGGTVERTFGSAIPGIDITARADSASVAVLLIACLASLLSLHRHRADRDRLTGALLCLAGAAFAATAGNLALAAGGVEVIAAGTLMLRGRRGPGARSAAVLAAVLAGAGLALLAAAAQLVAGAATSDLAAVPAGVIGAAIAAPWAIAGAALVLSAAIPGEGAHPARDFAAIAALPIGFLLLLRLQEASGGQPPGAASVVLTVGGAAAACAAALAGRRAVTLAAAGRSAAAVLAGVLVSLYGGRLALNGTILAGLFLTLELAMLAAASWTRQPSGWAVASTALLAVPGGAAFAVVAAGLAGVAHGGVGSFPQLAVLTGALAVAAVVAARAVSTPTRGWHPVAPGAFLSVAAGLAGGIVPGLALRLGATPLAGGAPGVDLDAGALALPGGGIAAGYLAAAAAILIVAVGSAVVLVADGPIGAPLPQARPLRLPPVRPLLRTRRRVAPAWRRAASSTRSLDRWLESQPGAALVLAMVVASLALVR